MSGKMESQNLKFCTTFAQSFTTCTTVDPLTFAKFSICVLNESQSSSVLSIFFKLGEVIRLSFRVGFAEQQHEERD